MTIRYSISYLESHSGGTFRFFGFRKKQKKQKCQKCMINEAVIEMTNTENTANNIQLCMVCYNDFTAEQLLGGRAAAH